MKSKLNYVLILIGGAIALYANADDDQDQYLLIGGIFVLMIGLYRLARRIPEKPNSQSEEDTNITQE